MAEIRFKALRTLHDSGDRRISKSGDLKFDQDPYTNVSVPADRPKVDGIWLRHKSGSRVFIDCERDGTFRLVFKDDEFELNYHSTDEKARLEVLRQQLRAENISLAEIAELQSLVDYIEPDDVELLEAAGVKEGQK